MTEQSSMPSMHLALLADYAAARKEEGVDKLHVIGGGIRALAFPAFPATRDRLALALGMEFPATEVVTPQHVLQIEAIGPGERPFLKPLTAAFSVRADPLQPNEPVYFHFVYNIENISFPAEGTYVFAIIVDTHRLGEVALRIVKAPGPIPRAIAAAILLAEGYEAFGRGDFSDAQQNFARAVLEFPEIAAGHNNLGFVQLIQGQPGEALAAFSKARELGFPQVELLDANVACAHYLLGDLTTAKIFFQQCLRVHGFRGPAVLFGINALQLFPVRLASASDYVALMSLNAGWSALRSGDRLEASSHADGARSAELTRRGDDSGRNFAMSAQTLKEQLT